MLQHSHFLHHHWQKNRNTIFEASLKSSTTMSSHKALDKTMPARTILDIKLTTKNSRAQLSL
eukprot:767955-Hanusia_phi.AAC.8